LDDQISYIALGKELTPFLHWMRRGQTILRHWPFLT